MKEGTQFSNLIYEYFFLRFRFGYYRYGDTLPAIDILCHEFNVSDQTVKAALRRLRAEGYISMRNGQATKVIFQQSKEEFGDFAVHFYSERWEAFFDLYESSELILVPIMMEGMRRMVPEDFQYVRKLAKRAFAEDLMQFFRYILQKAENPLALNLFWEITLFWGFPFARMKQCQFCYDAELVRQRMNTLLAAAQEKKWDIVRNSLIEYQRGDVSRVAAYLEPVVRHRPGKEQVSFVWRIYRERPQLCCSLAIRILYEIYMGEFREREYLPSYEKMAQRFNVSLSTVRRTINVLNQVGAAESVNGVGTRIFSMGKRCREPDLSSLAVRQNLALFFQSFELLIYSCEEVLGRLLVEMRQSEREELLDCLEENRNTGQCAKSLWHMLIWTARYSTLSSVREIYARIFGLFLWGYPLRGSKNETAELELADVQLTDALIQALREGEYARCAVLVKEKLLKEFPMVEVYLRRNKIYEGELRSSISIRLMLTDVKKDL